MQVPLQITFRNLERSDAIEYVTEIMSQSTNEAELDPLGHARRHRRFDTDEEQKWLSFA